MYRISSTVLNENILFLNALEKKEAIENKDNLVIYSYAEQHLINECKPTPGDLRFIHKLKKEFNGVIERRDYVSDSRERTNYQDERGARVKDERTAESIFDAAKSISISTDVFEFFRDYQKFRGKDRRVGGD